MTMLLEKAFSEANIAAIIMEELLAERKWDQSFVRSQDKLALLADEVLNDAHVKEYFLPFQIKSLTKIAMRTPRSII